MRSRNDRICSRSVSAMTSIYPQRVRFGPFEADLETHELWKNGVKLKLGGQPFEILALLLNRPGHLLSREELQKEIWAADTFVDFNHGLNAAVNKLRETLADSAEEPKYVETLPRRGYRFVGKVEGASTAATAESSANTPEAESAAPPPPLPVPTFTSEIDRAVTVAGASRRTWLSRSRIAVIGGSIAVAAVIFAVVLSKWPVFGE